jgi:hypothetical protein
MQTPFESESGTNSFHKFTDVAWDVNEADVVRLGPATQRIQKVFSLVHQ